MATPDRVKNKMKELGLSGVNKPKRTPSHKTKSHVVMAKEGDQHKLIRFGQQGVKGAGKNPRPQKTKPERNRIMLVMTHKVSPQPSCRLSIGLIR
jgi:tRNA(Ile2) C34 agmatinyltransferase TiaS